MKTRNYKRKQTLHSNSIGFGLVDAIVSVALLSGVITYSLYFSTLRLDIAHKSNLTSAVNKEIKRDIERMKSELWSMSFDDGEYNLDENDCLDISDKIKNLPNWKLNFTRPSSSSPAPPVGNDDNIQYWWPDQKRNRVFTGRSVLITRELETKQPYENEAIQMDKSIASISYRVQWADNNIHWLSIYLSPEAHSWCV